MKEKTLKDLGLDDNEQYLEKLTLDYDLGDFGDLSEILNKGNKNNEKENKQ